MNCTYKRRPRSDLNGHASEHIWKLKCARIWEVTSIILSYEETTSKKRLYFIGGRSRHLLFGEDYLHEVKWERVQASGCTTAE